MNITSTEFRELSGCNSMALSKSGQLALIAGRRAYGVLNLSGPFPKFAKKIRRNSKYEVTALEFSPHREELGAVASNDRVELVDWSGLRDRNLLAQIKEHSRLVNDISWHTKQRDLLATCSMDNFIYIWDTRDVRKPSIQLSSITGSTQVKWEKVTGKYLASTHEGEIKLWDIRRPSNPIMAFVNAHLSKIYSLDFSPVNQNTLVTSSQDLTVKLWHLSNLRTPTHVIRTPQAPVWKVKFTPFGGEGILALTTPNALQRGTNSLVLWNPYGSNDRHEPEFVFSGNSDIITEFVWRKGSYFPMENRDSLFLNEDDDEVYQDDGRQLLIWTKDATLKVWPLSSKIRELCGSYTPPDRIEEEIAVEATEEPFIMDETYPDEESPVISHNVVSLTVSSQLSSSLTAADNEYLNTKPPPLDSNAAEEEEEITHLLANSLPAYNFIHQSNLQQEFSLLNFSDRLSLEKLDLKERYCIIISETLNQTIILHIKFPENYPGSEVPIFSFLNGTTLEPEIKTALLRKLKLTAHQQAVKSRLCLEICLRQLENAVDNIRQSEADSVRSKVTFSNDIPVIYEDATIPFPRTSGARFCGSGQLVCFGYLSKVMLASNKPSSIKTPRALSATNPAPTFFGTQNNRRDVRFSRNSVGSLTPTKAKLSFAAAEPTPSELGYRIVVYDILPIASLSKVLAEKYIIPENNCSMAEACTFNAGVAYSFGRRDIARTWNIAATCGRLLDQIRYSKDQTNSDNFLWSFHPFGRKLLESLISHYVLQQDLQTAGTLLCTFHVDSSLESSNRFKASEFHETEKNLLGTLNVWDRRRRKTNSKSECSVDTGRDVAMENLASLNSIKHARSNSDTLSLDEFAKQLSTKISTSEDEPINSNDLLDPNKRESYDDVKRSYSELLVRLGLDFKAIEIRKKLSEAYPEMYLFTTLISRQCSSCNKIIKGGSHCKSCNQFVSSCCLCQLPTRGISSVCSECGHGGHLHHVVEWFETHIECPTGCGCKCVEIN